MNNSNKPFNILHLIDTTSHGGAETVLKTIVCGLDRSRFQSYVLLSDYGWLYDQLSGKPNVTVIVFNGKGRVNFPLLHKLGKIIRRYKIDLIHTHLFGSSFYGSIASFLFKVPVVSTFHGIPDWRPEDRLNKIKLSLVYFRAKAVVFVSNYLKSYFLNKAYVSLKESTCIYNGLPMPKKNPSAHYLTKKLIGFKEDDILIGSVGNIKPVKGYDVLLRAASFVVNQYPNTKFIVGGAVIDNCYAELLNLMRRLKLEESFFFLGYQEDPMLIYEASNLFVLPSLSEGFSLSIIEAMAHKLPIIATRSGGPEEILENGITGWLVEPNSASELSKAIIKTLVNKQHQEVMSENGYHCFINRFSSAKMVDNYQDLYYELLRK